MSFSPRTQKIGSLLRPDGSLNDNERIEIGPTQRAFDEWAALGITPPHLPTFRRDRLARVCAQLKAHDCAAALLFDPLNIRYATDSSNMSVWTTRNLSRATFVSADGYVVLWDFFGCGHLTSHLELIDELRHGAGFFYFERGDKTDQAARKFVDEIVDLLNIHGMGRLAVDRMEVPGVKALLEHKIDLYNGQKVLEHARLVKGPEDIAALRCAVASCEASMAYMQTQLVPGVTEVELWSHLHAQNIARGGEWIETRLLASGQRTNPWMAECGPRVISAGDIMSFDTDMVGGYGMCADISRAWICGNEKPTDEMREAFQMAHEHISFNTELLQAGTSFQELTFKAHRLPEKYRAQRYCVMMHGVGMCDEFPIIYYPEDFIEGAFDYELTAGMVMCVEAYCGEVGGKAGVKLEDMVLITENGPEILSTFPFAEEFMH